MPTYNGAAFVADALASVTAQEEDGVELVAVDDGSTDGTLAVLESYASRLPLRIVASRRRGNWVAGTNLGLELARGRFVSFLHQDDRWLPGRLSILRQVLERQDSPRLLLHSSWFVDPAGEPIGKWRCPLPSHGRPLASELVLSRLLVQNFVAVCAPLFPREEALRVGSLDESLWYTADWDFWLKLAARLETVHVPRFLAAFRLHRESQTQVRSSEPEDFRGQMSLVLERHLATCADQLPRARSVERAARFSIELNAAMAAWVHGRRPDWSNFVRAALRLGPGGCARFVRDSRVIERVGARVRPGRRLVRPA